MTRWRTVLRWFLLIVAGVLAVAALIAGAIWWYFHPSVQVVNGLVYGQRGGQDLVMDVIQPAKRNGLGIIVVVSGRWKSGTAGSFDRWIVSPLLRRGYTVFCAYHISQPEATVMDIIQDMHRAVRFVRHNARENGIDPGRIGVTGGSAGGHLSLMLAARGGPGPADAPDPVDRESSAVQAVAIFYPVTDLLNLGQSTENLGDGGPPKSFVRAFGPDSTNMAKWKVIGRESSPIYFLSSNLPPVLIYHGDADTLVPLEQSEWFQARARESGAEVVVRVHRGGGHGWPTMVLDLRHFADWFDQHLRRAGPK